jgi:hypothetical protein
MDGRTITTTGLHGYEAGDHISVRLTEPDPRWWRRAWFWVTGRRNPTRVVRYGGLVTSQTTIKLEGTGV